MTSREVNFDGLVGPTHNYAGLSFGNVASRQHGGQVSSPRSAALQGLEKMRFLHGLGLVQAVLPPHERPHVPTLRALGFQGTDAQVLAAAAKQAPHLLAAACSASAMWVANAATVSPHADCADGRTHFTPANLLTMFHRAIEPATTGAILKAVFAADDHYHHHPPLPAHGEFADEGAANHVRLCANYEDPGVELFVYGADMASGSANAARFPARQTRQACEAVVRSHGLDARRVVLAQQHPEAIDAGVFHNDVIAVGNRTLLFHHQLAFVHTDRVHTALRQALPEAELDFIEVDSAEVSLAEAVSSYLFNSQLVTPGGSTATSLIVPSECRENPRVHGYLESLRCDHSAIDDVHYLDLRQSMNNGGGPACLRLRVVLSDEQIRDLPARVVLDERLYQDLRGWVEAHYRDSLAPADLADPALLEESRRALDELTTLLGLGSIYEFQRGA